MSENEVKLLIRTTYRRMSRQRRAEAVRHIKVTLFWAVNIATILAFAMAVEYILFNRLVLKWILIFSFTVVFSDLMKSMEKDVKKSPRCRNTLKGHIQK